MGHKSSFLDAFLMLGPQPRGLESRDSRMILEHLYVFTGCSCREWLLEDADKISPWTGPCNLHCVASWGSQVSSREKYLFSALNCQPHLFHIHHGFRGGERIALEYLCPLLQTLLILPDVSGILFSISLPVSAAAVGRMEVMQYRILRGSCLFHLVPFVKYNIIFIYSPARGPPKKLFSPLFQPCSI